MDISFQYPPDLFNLLVSTIPLLNKGKEDTILFFKGAGVESSNYNDLHQRIKLAKDSINKYEIVRTILTRLNEKGEKTLRERREILKRVIEFENFSVCWPNDQLAAKGLVADIRSLINVRDSFTRMNQERKKSEDEKRKLHEKQVADINKKNAEIDEVKNDLYKLFSIQDPIKKGKEFEKSINKLFKSFNILVKESFVIYSEEGKPHEQIDGVINIDGHLYLVEVKWHSTPVEINAVTRHLGRVFLRGDVRGIIISTSNFTEAAINTCKEALSQKTVVLADFSEIVGFLENRNNETLDFNEFWRKKVNAAIIEKKPFLMIN